MTCPGCAATATPSAPWVRHCDGCGIPAAKVPGSGGERHVLCPACASQFGAVSYECPEHGPFGPATFCCACTRAKVEVERDRYRDALQRIINELGVPDETYPSPVANAVDIATEELGIT